MEKLIIDRKQWYRGHNQGSALRRKEDGCMCCLGFDLLRRGFTVEQITGVAVPEDVEFTEAQVERLDGLVRPCECYDDDTHYNPTKVNEELVTANDDPDLTETEREAKLTELFAEIGVAVEFVN